MMENKMTLTRDAYLRPCRPKVELSRTLTLKELQAIYDEMKPPTKSGQPFMVELKFVPLTSLQEIFPAKKLSKDEQALAFCPSGS